MDQGNMSDRIRLDYGSGTVQSDHQPHNHDRSLPPSSVSCPADLPSPPWMLMTRHPAYHDIRGPEGKVGRRPCEENSGAPRTLPCILGTRQCKGFGARDLRTTGARRNNLCRPRELQYAGPGRTRNSGPFAHMSWVPRYTKFRSPQSRCSVSTSCRRPYVPTLGPGLLIRCK
jgi:hypothetical protein